MRRLCSALLALTLITVLAPAAAAEPIFVAVRAHVQEVGWQPYVADSQTAGTTGRSLRLEAVQLRGGVGVTQAHVQDAGWLKGVPSGQVAGTTGKSKRLEAVRISSDVRGWRIECQAHVQDRGWLPWVGDGEVCGTTGLGLRMEAIRLRLIAEAVELPAVTSERPIDQKAMLIGYDTLKAQPGRAIIAASDASAVAISNATYNTDRGQLAVRDADITRLSNITSALPPKVKGYLDELTASGRVPRFRALLAGGADAMETPNSSSSDAKYYFAVVRPINANIGIKRVPNAGSVYSDVGTSPSFPSGHSRTSQVVGASLAVMLPEYAPQLLARGADSAHSRIVLGVHSPLDVIGGKAVGTRMVAQRLADPAFRRDVFEPAMRELRAGLERKCGTTIAECAQPASPAAAAAEYRQRLTYDLPQLRTGGVPLTVPDGAEALLTYTHLDLTAQQRRQILIDTAVDSGYPLDLTGTSAPASDIGWTRIDLAAALTR